MSLPSVAPESGSVESDTEVLRRIRNGDTNAYVLLYERHVGSARRFARSILHGGSDVEDVVSEVFASAFAAIKRGKGPADEFSPYLLSSLRRECYRSWRRGGKHHETSIEPQKVELVAPGGGDDSTELVERDVLGHAFEALPPRMQEVLWCTEVDGLSHAEIAERTKSTSQAVAVLAMRARRTLAEHYLQAHVSDVEAEQPATMECRDVRAHLAQMVRGTASRRHRVRASDHMVRCRGCGDAHDRLLHVNQRLRTAPLLAVLGAVAAPQLIHIGLRARFLAWIVGPAAPLTAATGLVVLSAIVPAAVPRAETPVTAAAPITATAEDVGVVGGAGTAGPVVVAGDDQGPAAVEATMAERATSVGLHGAAGQRIMEGGAVVDPAAGRPRPLTEVLVAAVRTGASPPVVVPAPPVVPAIPSLPVEVAIPQLPDLGVVDLPSVGVPNLPDLDTVIPDLANVPDVPGVPNVPAGATDAADQAGETVGHAVGDVVDPPTVVIPDEVPMPDLPVGDPLGGLDDALAPALPGLGG